MARDTHDTPLARTPAASAGVVELVAGSGHCNPGILSTCSFHATPHSDGRV
ncbi:MAG TPA: hypothetical protein VLA43_13600 [Longimicrobiales bacterium]|nr:hypothetical protein [Longimicrobiales bacterium]